MLKVYDLVIERMQVKKIEDKENGKTTELAKVLYVTNKNDFYIGYLSMYDVDKNGLVEGSQVQGIFDNGKIKLLG